MNSKIFLILFGFVFWIMIPSESYGQTFELGDSPYGREFIGIKYLDAYFGTIDEKIEISSGDQNVPLTVVMTNVGSNDIIGIQGQLSLPFGFSDIHNKGMLVQADSETNAITGDIFSITFYVNVAENTLNGVYPASLKIDYSRLRESGGRTNFFPVEFHLTGDSVINVRAVEPFLTSLKENHVQIEIANDGTAPISAVDIELINTQSEIASTTTSITNVENVIILSTNWDVGQIDPGEKKILSALVYVPESLKGETLRAPIQITYYNAQGDRHTISRIVDFYVNGLVDISINQVKVKTISEKSYIIGNVVNEGNADGLFGYVSFIPQNGSNLKSLTTFVDEIETDSPVPFNMPVEFEGEPTYGDNELEISVRYKDALRDEYFVNKTFTLFLEEPPIVDESELPIEFILSGLGIIGVVIFLGKRGYLPFTNHKKSING